MEIPWNVTSFLFRVKFPKVWWLTGSVKVLNVGMVHIYLSPKKNIKKTPFTHRLSHLHDLHEASSTGLGWWPNYNVSMNRHGYDSVMIVGFYQMVSRLFTDAEKSGSVDDLSVVVLTWSVKVHPMDNEPFQDAPPIQHGDFREGTNAYQCQYQWEFNLVAPKTISEKLITDQKPAGSCQGRKRVLNPNSTSYCKLYNSIWTLTLNI